VRGGLARRVAMSPYLLRTPEGAPALGDYFFGERNRAQQFQFTLFCVSQAIVWRWIASGRCVRFFQACPSSLYRIKTVAAWVFQRHQQWQALTRKFHSSAAGSFPLRE